MKIPTIDLKGKSYATVPARIKEFREANPSGEIKTKPEIQADGQVIFTAYILKDKSNPSSASATGHSIGKITGDKAFEKLETIAIGRALAILGYMASGDIASSEEMEEFENYKKQQREKAKQYAIESLNEAKTQVELKQVWGQLGNMVIEPEIIALKDALKIKLK
jgi:hypothetical protein